MRVSKRINPDTFEPVLIFEIEIRKTLDTTEEELLEKLKLAFAKAKELISSFEL